MPRSSPRGDPPRRRKARSCSSAQVCEVDGIQPDRLAASAERHHKEQRAAVLARLWIPHHRSGAVIDLCFFTGRSDNYPAWFARCCTPQLAYVALTLSYAPVKPWRSTSSCQIAIALRPRANSGGSPVTRAAWVRECTARTEVSFPIPLMKFARS
jgi:hypothetical protein